MKYWGQGIISKKIWKIKAIQGSIYHINIYLLIIFILNIYVESSCNSGIYFSF